MAILRTVSVLATIFIASRAPIDVQGYQSNKQHNRFPCQSKSKILEIKSNYQNIQDKGVLHSRRNINNLIKSTFLISPLIFARKTNAFEGGVGGLGKTKPNTGVRFANPDLAPDISSVSIPGSYNAELVAPDGTRTFMSFYAQWPMLKSQGIESRDLANAEASFVQVAQTPDGYNGILKKKFFADSVFAQTGKYGAYGDVSDVKVSKVDSNDQRDLYLVSFTTLTPAMRESDRKAYISTKVVGDGVFMLVTGSTMQRFGSQEKLLRKVADSFECLEAPKSSLRR